MPARAQVTTAIITFVVTLLLSYIWVYWHYYYISKNKLYNVLYNLTKGEWPSRHLKSENKISVSLYKTVITLLINTTLSNENKNLRLQVLLTSLLIITQLMELYYNKILKRVAVIYYTCVSSILVLILVFTIAGLVISLFQAVLNLEYTRSEYVSNLHYWYWKSFTVALVAVYVLMLR